MSVLLRKNPPLPRNLMRHEQSLLPSVMDKEEQNDSTLHRQLVKKNVCIFCKVNCKNLEKGFESKNGLKAHNKCIHRRMITCGICEQAFATAADKKIHDRIMKHRGKH